MIALPDLPATLRRAYPDAPVPTYRKLYILALDGVVPVQRCNTRLFVENADVPRIAALLGLTERAAA